MSLERMDAIFGEVDAVAAGEVEVEAEKMEARVFGETEKDKDKDKEKEKEAGHSVEHKEDDNEGDAP